MRHNLKRILLFLLAIVFLIEAWLWDMTGLLIKRALGWFPYAHLKAWVARRVEHLSPWLTLCVLIIPVLVLLPLKFLTVWLLAKGYLMVGIGMALLAKLLGLGISSFLFTLCKPKLVELRFIRWLYTHSVYWRERARVMVSPYISAAKALAIKLRGYLPSGGMIGTMRKKIHGLRRR